MDHGIIIAIVSTGMGIIISMGAITIALFLHSSARMDKFSERIIALETDFKNFMKREEEKRTQIILDRHH